MYLILFETNAAQSLKISWMPFYVYLPDLPVCIKLLPVLNLYQYSKSISCQTILYLNIFNFTYVQ